MPDILIRGIGIPSKSDLVVHIYQDGKAVFYPFHGKPRKVKVLELPPHGDLIDVSKVVLEYGGLVKISPHDFVGIAKYFSEQIEGQPVVVPAERRDADA